MRILFALLACDGNAADDSGSGESGVLVADGDGDGVPDDEDCAPDDEATHPGVAETPYDGIDNDCDAATLDDDLDQDGALAADDCDDGDPALSPAATELCDGVDNDCDGTADEDVQATWYADADGDGWGEADAPVLACDAPEGTADAAGDCNDADAAVNPDAAEACDGVDNDCDGVADPDADEATWGGTWRATFSGGTMGYDFAITCEGSLTTLIDPDASPAVTVAMDADCCEEVYGSCYWLYFEGDPSGSGIAGTVGSSEMSACADYACGSAATWEGTWTEPGCAGDGGAEVSFAGVILYPAPFWTYAWAEGSFSLRQQ